MGPGQASKERKKKYFSYGLGWQMRGDFFQWVINRSKFLMLAIDLKCNNQIPTDLMYCSFALHYFSDIKQKFRLKKGFNYRYLK